MSKFKRVLRLCAFICLIILATVGVGLSGGVPLTVNRNKRTNEKDKTEMIDSAEADTKIVKPS